MLQTLLSRPCGRYVPCLLKNLVQKDNIRDVINVAKRKWQIDSIRIQRVKQNRQIDEGSVYWDQDHFLFAFQQSFDVVKALVIYEDAFECVSKLFLQVQNQGKPNLLADACVKLLDLILRVLLIQLNDSSGLDRLLTVALPERVNREKEVNELLELIWVDYKVVQSP